MPDNAYDFGLFFYNTFIDPLIDICKSTQIFGFSLFSWLLGLSIVALGVRFVRTLFGFNNNDSEKG